ncbi:MAG: hypothetical protein AAGB01_03055 [Cyanobacteria bacterium P01_F01_bin.42]
MTDNQKQKKSPMILDVDAGTLLLWVGIIILAPLLLTGFFAH